MIRTEFLTKPSGELVGFRISGHSGQGVEGTDIVCAAVSSAAYLIANTVTEILMVPAETVVKDGKMSVQIGTKDAALCRAIFAGFKLHMLALEEEYSDYIKLSYTEV